MSLTKLLNDREERILREERTVLAQLRLRVDSIEPARGHAEQLDASIRQLDELFLLIVAGEFNAGKSAFINAVLGRKLLAEGVTPTTEQITLVRYGDGSASTRTDRAAHDGVETTTAPVELLRQINIVDTPGTNAIHREHEALTRNFIPRADLVLFVTSADRPFTETERQFLERIRDWGKKVVVIVNKVDLLTSSADREEVLAFVRDNGKRLLGSEPRVIALSARMAGEAIATNDPQRLQESNLPEVTTLVEHTLDNRERIRLKLLNPLGVGISLCDTCLEVVASHLELLQDDLAMLDEVERSLNMYAEDQNREFSFRLSDIDNTLLDFENRGNVYFEETLRLGRIFDLTNKDRIKAEFERKVVADLPTTVDKRVEAVIDWMVASELRQWKAVSDHLEKQQDSHRDRMVGRPTRHFDQDRRRLLDKVGGSAKRAIAGYDREQESTRLAESTRSAVASTALVEVGAVGLGAVVSLIATTTATDVTGILAAGAVSLLGLFILPAKRRSAKRELASKVSRVREQLMTALRKQFAAELASSVRRIDDALAPYTRFVRSEHERLVSARRDLTDSRRLLASLKKELGSSAE